MYIRSIEQKTWSKMPSVFPALIGIVITLGMRSNLFTYAALLLCVGFIIFFEEKECIPLLFFLVPFANIFKTSAQGTSFFTYVVLLFVALHFIKTKTLLKNYHLLISVLGLYIIANSFIAGAFDLKKTIKFVSNLLLVSVLTEVNAEESYVAGYKHFVYGFIITGFIVLFGSSFLPIEQYVVTKVARYGDGSEIYRFAGFYTDPNYYSINLIVCLFLLIFLYHNKHLMFPSFLVLMATTIFLIGQTGSKSALIMMAFPMFTLIWLNHKSQNYWMTIVWCLILLVGVILVSMGKITIFNSVLRRITIDNPKGMDELSTGRTSIWGKYLEYFAANPLVAVVGNGVGIDNLANLATHNTYIDFIYQLGFIGTALYVGIIIQISRANAKKILRYFANYMVWGCILIMYFFLSQLQEFDLPFQIAIALNCYNIPLFNKEEGNSNENTSVIKSKSKYIKS